MQGQRGTIGSLPEILDFDHGSTSSNAAVDQQVYWNNMRNTAENRLPDFLLPPNDTDITYLNSISHEQQNRSGWSLGESSSIARSEVNHDEGKTEHGWSSSVSACPGTGPRLEEHRYGQTNILSLDNVNVNPLFMQSSNSDVIRQNLNLNADFVGHGGDNSQVMECSTLYKTGLENERIPPTSGSDPFHLSSGTGGYLVEETDGRPGCSLGGRRVSCKRKGLEGNVGQSSVSGNCSSSHQHAESSAWPAVPVSYNAGLSAAPEQVNPRLGLGVRRVASDSLPDSTVAGNGESSQRNVRQRINPSNQQGSVPPTLFSTGSAVSRSGIPSSQQSSRVMAVGQSLGMRPAPATDNTVSQSQPFVIRVPALPRNVQPFRWNGGSSSRTGSSSSSAISGDREAALREGSRSRSVSRNSLENPMFVATELRNAVRNPTNRSLTSGTISIPGNVASTSWASSSSGGHPASAPTWVPPHNPTSLYPRRLSEYVRRSLFSSVGSESGGESSNYSSLHSGPPTSSQEMVFSSGDGNQGPHHSYPRSALWMERQGDGVLGIPHPLRTLPASNEGRGRLVSEIRNVLGLMRRGEGLRFEDVMLLDQSLFFGMAEIQDRHRDMRLDVDNMSYEELLALEERIGNVNTGLSEENISNRLKRRKCSIALEPQVEAEPCCICQEVRKDGEDLGTLDCGHDFHTDCIKQWLMLKNLCPICKTTALT